VNSSKEEWKARFRLDSTPGIGHRLQKRLYDRYGSARAIFAASSVGLSVEGIGPAKRTALRSHAVSSSLPAQGHGTPIAANRQSKTSLIGYPDEAFPSLLREISDPPPFFWVQGDVNLLQLPCVAIVGTRRASAYGRRTAHQLAFELALAGIAIVSGLAYGIDRAAHEGALDAGGVTIAILGSGVDEIYPRAHRALAGAIAEKGCLMSEFEPASPPEQANFPKRNRIISGLSRATIVVEAFQKAGALITAGLCIEQKRDLYAVPGRIGDTTSTGTNALLAESAAQLLHSSNQIIDEFKTRGWIANPEAGNGHPGRIGRAAASGIPRSRLERAVLTCLATGSRHLDDINSILEYPGPELWTAILQLECEGLIKAGEGNWYEKVSIKPV